MKDKFEVADGWFGKPLSSVHVTFESAVAVSFQFAAY